MEIRRKDRHFPSTCAIIAAYNEAHIILKTVASTRSYVEEVIVIDDGSREVEAHRDECLDYGEVTGIDGIVYARQRSTLQDSTDQGLDGRFILAQGLLQ